MFSFTKLITRGVGVLLGAAFIGSGCQPSKKQMDLQEWLDQEFPGEWKEEFGLRDLHPKHWGTKKTTSYLTSRKDSLVQMQVVWYKAEPGLGIDRTTFEASAKSSHDDVAHGKEMLQRALDAGCERFSIAMIDSALYLLFFTEGNKEQRAASMKAAQAMLATPISFPVTQIWIEFVEPEARGVHFNEIVPFNYWTIQRGYHDQHQWLRIPLTPEELNDIDALSGRWELNAVAKRVSALRDKAYEKASEWADKNLESNLKLRGTELTSFDANPDSVVSAGFEFAIVSNDKSEEEQELELDDHGYIAVIYHLDQDAFTEIKRVNEQ